MTENLHNPEVLVPPFKGEPTDWQVRKLHEAFGVIEPGRVITYKEVTDVIGEPHNSHRFNTITWRWRKDIEKNQGVYSDVPYRKKEFRFLQPNEQVDHGCSRASSGRRRHLKGLVETVRAPQEVLDSAHQRKRLGAEYSLEMAQKRDIEQRRHLRLLTDTQSSK